MARESGVGADDARALVTLAERLRALHDRGLVEVPSTRLLVAAGYLIRSGMEHRRACVVAVVTPLTDDPTLIAAMRDIVDATFV